MVSTVLFPLGASGSTCEVRVSPGCTVGFIWSEVRLWKGLKAGGEVGKRMRWLDGITDSMDVS